MSPSIIGSWPRRPALALSLVAALLLGAGGAAKPAQAQYYNPYYVYNPYYSGACDPYYNPYACQGCADRTLCQPI